MPAYQAYPTIKTTPSRKMRKGQRNKVFLTNKKMTRKALLRAASLTIGK